MRPRAIATIECSYLKLGVHIPSLNCDATILLSLEDLPEVYAYLYLEFPGGDSPGDSVVPEEEPAPLAQEEA